MGEGKGKEKKEKERFIYLPSRGGGAYKVLCSTPKRKKIWIQNVRSNATGRNRALTVSRASNGPLLQPQVQNLTNANALLDGTKTFPENC